MKRIVLIISLLLPLSIWSQATEDSIQLEKLLTYSTKELDQKINTYYNNLEIQDSFDLYQFIDALTFGDHYDMIQFDSLISNIDWNEATKKIDWKAALNHFDWNEMMNAMCEAQDSLFSNAPIRIDIPEDSPLHYSNPFTQSDISKCLDMSDMSKMMQAMDVNCLMQSIDLSKMNDPNASPFSALINKAQGKGDGGPDFELMCSIAKCIDMNILFDDFDWNCMFENFDFNMILRNWKMDDWAQSLNNINLHQGDSVLTESFKDHPLFKIMDKDSIKFHFEKAFEDFFDPQSVFKMNQNFYDKIINDNWQADSLHHLQSILELTTPVLKQITGDTRSTRYFSSALWLFYEMQAAVAISDYEKALEKQLFLRDVLIHFMQEDLLNQLVSDFQTAETNLPIPDISNNPFLNTFEDMLWSIIGSVEQFIGISRSVLGQHTAALINFERALKISNQQVQKIDIDAIEQNYLQTKFTSQEKKDARKLYGINDEIFYLNLEQIQRFEHPKAVAKLIKIKDFQAALDYYHVMKDMLFEFDAIPTYLMPNPAANQPYKFLYIMLIYQQMADVLERAKLTNDSRYTIYNTARENLLQYQQYLQKIFLHNNLGTYYFLLNDYELCEIHLLKAWNRIKKVRSLDYIIPSRPAYEDIDQAYKNNFSTYVGLAANLGHLYLSQNRYEEAQTFLMEAISFLQTINSVSAQYSEQDLFEIYLILGKIHLAKKELGKAKIRFSKCDTIAQQSSFQQRKLLAQLYLGYFYNHQKAYKKALDYFKKATIIATNTNKNSLLAQIHLLSANAHQKLEQTPLALKNYAAAEKLARDRSLYTVLQIVYTQKGKHYAVKNEHATALEYFEKGIQIIEDSLFHHTLSENARQLSLENSYTAYEGAISSALKLKQKEKAFQYLQQSKVRTFNELLATASLKDETIPEHLRDKKQQITLELNNLSNNPNAVNFRSEQQALLQERTRVNAQIRAAVPKYEQLLNPTFATYADLQKELNPNQAFIAYSLGEKAYAFIITKTNFEILNLGEVKPIYTAIKVFKNTVDTIKDGESASFSIMNGAKVKMSNASQQLYDILMDTIQKNNLLVGINELLIASDQALYLIPFELLSKSSAKPIFHDFKIAYTQSASTFLHQQKNKTIDTYSKTILALSKYNFKEHQNLKNLKRLDTSIFKLPASQCTFLQEENATLKQLQQSDLVAHRYIYIATHAIIESNPQLSRLALTNSDLYLYNTFTLSPLKTELIILSACQTARGVFKRGSGLMGFTRGLMYAGAKSVIVSLWKVDDEATSVFFEYFFQFIAEGKTPKEALQASKEQMIKSEKYQHPFYWSAFVLFGTN